MTSPVTPVVNKRVIVLFPHRKFDFSKMWASAKPWSMNSIVCFHSFTKLFVKARQLGTVYWTYKAGKPVLLGPPADV
jgi:hypothetical protein